MDEQLKLIKEIRDKWLGRWINSSIAMCEIDKILCGRIVSNLVMIDINTNEVMLKVDEALFI